MSTGEVGLGAAIAVLGLNAMAIEVLDEFERCDIKAVLLKGPVTASWLYRDPNARYYGDVDILVHPGDFIRARDVLHRIGFVDGQPHTLRVHLRYNAQQFTRGLLSLDLHRSLAAMQRTLADTAVDRLLRGRVRFSLAGHSVWALEPAARTAHLAWHVAQSKQDSHALRDLATGLRVLPLDSWRAAEELSREVDLLGAFAAGLRAHPDGVAVARALGLTQRPPMAVAAAMRGANQETLALLEVAAAPRGARLQEIGQWFAFGPVGLRTDSAPLPRILRVRRRATATVRLLSTSVSLFARFVAQAVVRSVSG